MSYTPPCSSCSCPCLLINLHCLQQKSLAITQQVFSHLISKLPRMIDLAQKKFLCGLSGFGIGCLKEICEALRVSNLSTDDPDYVPLDEKYEEFIFQVEDLIITSVEYYAFLETGRGKLTEQGFQSAFTAKHQADTFNDEMLSRYAAVEAAWEDFNKGWWDCNKDMFECATSKSSSKNCSGSCSGSCNGKCGSCCDCNNDSLVNVHHEEDDYFDEGLPFMSDKYIVPAYRDNRDIDRGGNWL